MLPGMLHHPVGYKCYPVDLRMRFDECFVGLSFPQVPFTLLIIIRYFESPATTFGLVKATRLTA